jgi:hypothetical protein
MDQIIDSYQSETEGEESVSSGDRLETSSHSFLETKSLNGSKHDGKELNHYTSSNSDHSEHRKMDVDEKIPRKRNQSTSSISSQPTTSASSIPTTTPITLKVISHKTLIQSCEYIPMRLTEAERLQLNVLEHALEVSFPITRKLPFISYTFYCSQVCEYTDVVDVTFSHTRKNKYTRILESLIDALSISCGLITSNNLIKGEALLKNDLNANVPLFRDLFEIGRRFKIMNPSKMRNTYGKLMYLLMDAESGMVKSEIKVNFVKPILTISAFLETKLVPDMISDPLFYAAVTEKQDMIVKEENLKLLIARYISDTFTKADIQRVIDSINDNESYKFYNVRF